MRVALLVLALAAAACGRDPLACADLPRAADGALACDPLYAPTFDNAYDDTFAVSCALGGCHTGARAKGGLDLSARDGAYAALLADGADRVIPGDPACSRVIARVTTDDPDWHMPPGATLTATEVCSLARWIDEGAAR